MITVREMLARADAARRSPPAPPPLSASEIKLIDDVALRGAASEHLRNKVVKNLSAMSIADRAKHLITLAMANPIIQR
jgi:hypothetical protein